MNTSDIEKSTTLAMIVIFSFILGAIIQIMTWDKYAIDIIPYQFRELIFSTSPSDWEKKADMCMDLKKWSCVEHEYAKAAKVDHNKYLRLGQFQMRRSKFTHAADSFAVYFKNGGEDAEGAFSYAKTLVELQRDRDAEKYFSIALEARPHTLHVPVVIPYVKILIRNGKIAEARRLIETVRDQNPTGRDFMAAEYQQIKKLRTASRD